MLLQLFGITGFQVEKTCSRMRVDVLKWRFFPDQVIKHFYQHNVLDNIGKITCMKRMEQGDGGIYGIL